MAGLASRRAMTGAGLSIAVTSAEGVVADWPET